MSARQLGAGNIPIRNAWHMLLYAWDMVALGERWRGAAEHSPSLLALLARVLADATDSLLTRDLARQHQHERVVVDGIRGRVAWPPTLARQQHLRGTTTCDVPVLVVDTPRNRILKATLTRLATDGRLAPTGNTSLADLRGRLRRLAREMVGVRDVRISPSDFSRLQLGRNDRAYALPMAICELLQRGQVPTEESGDHVLRALLRDEIRFHQLFEKFVLGFYRHHLAGWRARSETLRWPDTGSGSDFVPVMRTDVSLDEQQAPHRRIVVDTKFYGSPLAKRHERSRFHSANLYQMYAYLRTQEHLGDRYRDARGLLLYPAVGEHLDERLQVQGHEIRVATVDLADGWEAVEARLLAVVDAGPLRAEEVCHP